MEVLFASVPVVDLRMAMPWYQRVFGRTPDIIPNDSEVMWQVTGNGWLYVIQDVERAGRTVSLCARRRSIPNPSPRGARRLGRCRAVSGGLATRALDGRIRVRQVGDSGDAMLTAPEVIERVAEP